MNAGEEHRLLTTDEIRRGFAALGIDATQEPLLPVDQVGGAADGYLIVRSNTSSPTKLASGMYA